MTATKDGASFSVPWLIADGFAGFVTIQDLRESRRADVPQEPCVYVVVRAVESDPIWLELSTGGHFKRRDPTVALAILKERIVPGTPVLYIGKADQLRRRVSQYVRFGSGASTGHWGGRLIWQLADSGQLQIAWQLHDQPRLQEKALIQLFVDEFGCMPLANLAR